MNGNEKKQTVFTIWIDWTNRIISFQKVEGFETKTFSSSEERLEYAFQKCANGYRIQ